ncbi:MAG: hypothetical protein LBT92_03765 [Rickettsiales bacterium]|jgi:hypothetical protein|nr:hypothetical protein [Rickettsiales bacterium]
MGIESMRRPNGVTNEEWEAIKNTEIPDANGNGQPPTKAQLKWLVHELLYRKKKDNRHGKHRLLTGKEKEFEESNFADLYDTGDEMSFIKPDEPFDESDEMISGIRHWERVGYTKDGDEIIQVTTTTIGEYIRRKKECGDNIVKSATGRDRQRGG